MRLPSITKFLFAILCAAQNLSAAPLSTTSNGHWWLLGQRLATSINSAFKIITHSDLLKQNSISSENFKYLLPREIFRVTEVLSEETVRGLESFVKTSINKFEEEIRLVELQAQLSGNQTVLNSTQFLEQKAKVEELKGYINLGRTIACGIKIGSKQGYNLFEILNKRVEERQPSQPGTPVVPQSANVTTTQIATLATTNNPNLLTTTQTNQIINSLTNLSNAHIISQNVDSQTLFPIFNGLQSLMDLGVEVLSWQVEDICVYAEKEREVFQQF